MNNGGAAQIVAGGLSVAVLALLVEAILALVQRQVTPKPLRKQRRRRRPVAVPAG